MFSLQTERVFVPGLSLSSGRQWCWLSDPCRGGEYNGCSCCVRSPGEQASFSCWASASSTTLHEMAHVGGKHDDYLTHSMWMHSGSHKNTGYGVPNNVYPNYTWHNSEYCLFILLLMHRFSWETPHWNNKHFSFQQFSDNFIIWRLDHKNNTLLSCLSWCAVLLWLLK